MRVFVSQDAASKAVGADALAAAFTAAGAEVVRTGSRGMFWLEPMAEVETPEGRGEAAQTATSTFLTFCGHPIGPSRLRTKAQACPTADVELGQPFRARGPREGSRMTYL